MSFLSIKNKNKTKKYEMGHTRALPFLGFTHIPSSENNSQLVI
jgi:hypothetical protein